MKGADSKAMVDTKFTQIWNTFVSQEKLSEKAAQQFERYLNLLLQWNEDFNLTAITQPHKIVLDHFQDSLKIGEFINIADMHTIVDVGSGGGFPGIPLKIKYPHVHVVLIEVTHKKISFLQHVIEELGLEGIEVYALDWRTFLRTTQYEGVDLFMSRASLHTDELMRVFKPSCPYNQATLVYWASEEWQPGKVDTPYVSHEYKYQIGNKKRRFIVFKKVSAS